MHITSDNQGPEWTDEDQDELDQLRSGVDENSAPRQTIDRRRGVSVRAYDALMCYKKGEWNNISDEMRKRYVMILRRSACKGTFASKETREQATATLNALGIPLESEKKQRAANKEPLTEKELANIAKSRRKLVDRQKRLILERLNLLHAGGMTTVPEPGPYQRQAIEELVEAGEVVLIREDDVQLLRGAKPRDGSPRRKRHIVMLGLPYDEARYRKDATERRSAVFTRDTGTAVSLPKPPPETEPEPVMPAPPAEDEDDLI